MDNEASCIGKSIFPESKNLSTIKKPHLKDVSSLQDSYNIFNLDLVDQ